MPTSLGTPELEMTRRQIVNYARIAARSLIFSAVIATTLLTCSRSALAGAGQNTEQQVSSVLTNVLKAWGRADPGAIAAQYEPDGDFVSPDGMHAARRRAIAAFYRGAFARGYAGTRATAQVLHERNLSPTVVLVDGSWRIEPTPASKVRQPEAGLFFAVLHRQGGRWRIAALREQAGARVLREISGPGPRPPPP